MFEHDKEAIFLKKKSEGSNDRNSQQKRFLIKSRNEH